VFELWNEMDWQVSASDYAKMLIDTVPAIKKVNSNVKIAVMCTSRVNENEREWIKDVIQYIKYTKWLNPADYMDIISIHPYTRNIAPEEIGCDCGQEDDKAGALKERVAALRQMLDHYKLSEVGIIATEMGYYSTPDAVDSGRWNGGLHHDGLSERQQADYSVRTAALLYNDLEHMQFYCVNKTATGDLSEDGYGVTRTFTGIELPYQAKPVYAALAAFNSLLGNAEIIEEKTDDGKYDYVFETASGKEMHLIWTKGEAETISYEPDAVGVYIYDVYGNKKYIPCTNGAVNIDISGSPIYVENVDFVLTNSNGGEFKWSDSSVKLSSYIMPEQIAAGKDIWLICGKFKDGKMISVKAKDIKNSGLTETEAFSTADADEIRAFLWEDLKPIDDKCIKYYR